MNSPSGPPGAEDAPAPPAFAEAPSAHPASAEADGMEHLASVGTLYVAVAHDVRNPINVVKTSAYFLQSKVGSTDPRLARHIELINTACNNAARILEDLVRYAAHRPDPKPVDLSGLARESTRQCGDAASRIEVVIGGPDTPLLLDRELVVMAVGKLLQRSIAGAPPETPVYLRLSAEDGFLSIQVEDSGPPLSEFQRQTLNQPLSAADSQRPTNLSLALVSEIARRQGGCVRAVALEEGSLVGLELPLKTA